jgi:aminocarboxymuconate-semialdehyde decarboxylase
MIVDTHCHLFPADWQPLGRMPADMFDVEGQLARMDEGGVATCLVSDPHIWYGDLDLGDVAQARAHNDFLAELGRAHPGRFVGLGSVTPWRGEEHLAEARRAVEELGLAGFALATSDRGRYLDHVPPAFWELVTELAVPVFVHPGGVTVGQDLMDSYRLGEVCGRPLDMTVTLARFILTGTVERFPGVRLLCAHAGGAITMVADRLDFGHELRDYAPLGPWGEVHLERPPSDHVRALHLDTVTFGPEPLRLALATVGHEQVCFGTDGPPVPFPVRRHLDVVDALGLDEEARAAVLGGNARALFALQPVG